MRAVMFRIFQYLYLNKHKFSMHWKISYEIDTFLESVQLEDSLFEIRNLKMALFEQLFYRLAVPKAGQTNADFERSWLICNSYLVCFDGMVCVLI